MTRTIEPAAETLYAEIVAHLESCRVDKKYLSDTWDHTLAQKGRLFPLSVMQTMLAPGNRVNTWIDDSNHLVDETILDPKDEIAAKLLAFGESDFGAPRRDLRLDGKYYSSNFVHHVYYASRLIREIEARGIARPRVLEIGGGLAGVAYLLRRWFGDKLTYFAADLPETLFIQEWYLRNSFPEAPTSYKGTERPVETKAGGLNFINAYTLDSQDYAIDVALNIDSMQEMNAEAVALYVRYIQRNLTDEGFFFCQNHYGHASDAYAEPTEYPLDARWRIHSAEISPDLEGCGCEQMRLIYQRTATTENAASRRVVLRALSNVLHAARVPNDAALVAELAALPAKNGPADAAAAVSATLKRRGYAVPEAWIAGLEDKPYFPVPSYVPVLDAAAPRAPGEDFKQRQMGALWRLQAGVLQAMARGAKAEEIRALCVAAGPDLKDTASSEFWTGYFGAAFFALGQPDLAGALIKSRTARSKNPFWLTRFAYLWHRFGNAAEAGALLDRIDGSEPGEYFVDLKRAELEAACGRAPKAAALLAQAKASAGTESARWACLSRTAARVGDLNLAFDAAKSASDLAPDSLGGLLLDILPDASTDPRATALLKAVEARAAANPDQAIQHAFLLLRTNRRDEALKGFPALEKRFSEDYFRLGGLGRLAQQNGLRDMADRCLARSLEFRPGTFLHCDFVGNSYFGAGRFAEAASYYARALAFKPYLKHILAKDLYCRLPAAGRAVFGMPSGLRLVFQREQDFYHDLGPASK